MYTKVMCTSEDVETPGHLQRRHGAALRPPGARPPRRGLRRRGPRAFAGFRTGSGQNRVLLFASYFFLFGFLCSLFKLFLFKPFSKFICMFELLLCLLFF